MLSIELTSPVNCVEEDAETIFYLSIKNTNTYTVTLKENQNIDMILVESYSPTQSEHLWSQSADYPENMSTTFAPGEERLYEWRWRATLLDKEAVQSDDQTYWLKLYAIFDVGVAPHPTYFFRNSASIELYVGYMSWFVGGYAGSIPISCEEVLRHTGQLAATATVEAER